jgi:uncharacterized protein (TIGR02271 family)
MIQPEESCTGPAPQKLNDTVTIPEIQEFADISKRVIETGTVRITKHVHEVHRTVQPTLHEQRADVKRVPINRIVKTAPPVRIDGDTTIIPVIEEVVVKLILLTEEVHVTTRTIEKPSPAHDVTLRREEIEVQREPPPHPDKKS